MMIIALIICILKDYILFSQLPYYDPNTSLIAASFHASHTLIIILGLFVKAITDGASFEGSKSLIGFWFASQPILIKIYLSVMRSIFEKIYLTPSELKNYYHILHFEEVSTYFLKRGKIWLIEEELIDYSYLLYSGIQAQHRVLEEDEKKSKEKVFLEVSRQLMRRMIDKYPKMQLARILLASSILERKESQILVYHLVEEGKKNRATSSDMLSLRHKFSDYSDTIVLSISFDSIWY